ncbi:Ig-like domain-containing protein [uncultured Subdoligranulum sp.]|nr:Ig-like domain-containing protein [uncultured Subdoligranulum sp.]
MNNGKLTAGGSGGIGIYYRWTNPSDSGTSSLTVSGNAVVDTRDSKILIASQASEVQVSAGSDGNGGIVFDGKSGTVYGNVTLDDPLTVGAGETLTIPKGSTLTVPEGATLTNNGTITVQSGGTLEGTPTGNGTVEYKVTGVSLDKATLELFTGGSETLTATFQPANATNQDVTWSSDKPEVATVEGGTVKAVGEGEATIIVTTVDGGKTATCKVTVTQATYSISADISPDFGSVYTGYTRPAAQTVTITNTGNQTLNLEQPASTKSFEVGTLSRTPLAPGEKATFTVQPKAGLAAGVYREEIQVSDSGNVTLSIPVSFSVQAAAAPQVTPAPAATPAPSDNITYYTCPSCGYHNWTATEAGYRCDNCGYLESTRQLSGYGNVKGTYTPGSGAAAPAASTIPQTGDESNPVLWTVLLLVSGLALGGLALRRKTEHSRS